MRSRSGAWARRRVLVATGVVALIGAAPVAARAAVLPIPSVPTLPTTTTTVAPTTTTTAPTSTSTTTPATTTTTRAPATSTTTRPAPTTTTAPGATTTAPSATTSGTAGPTGAVLTPTPRTARGDRRLPRLPVVGGVGGPAPGSSPAAPVATPAPSRVFHTPRPGSDPVPGSAEPTGSGWFDGLGTMTVPLVLAALLAGALAVVALVARSRDPWRRAARAGPGTLVVDRYDTDRDVADRLVLAVRSGPVTVVGADCRSLQRLVKVAANEGLEIVDREGYVLRASRRLVAARGTLPDRRRLPLAWSVIVEPRTVDVRRGWEVRRTDASDGRVLSFAPGTPIVLWDGDLLR